MCQAENRTTVEQSCENVSIHRNNQSLKSTEQISDLQLGYVYIIKKVAEVESDGEITVLNYVDTPMFESSTTSIQLITMKTGVSKSTVVQEHA